MPYKKAIQENVSCRVSCIPWFYTKRLFKTYRKCAMCIPYLYLRQFLLIVTLTSEVLPSNLQLFTSSFVFTCPFYKVFGRYLLCCVRIELDWIQILVHQLDWTGLGSVARGFGLDWIVSTRSIPYSASGYVTMLTRAWPKAFNTPPESSR